MKTVQEQLQESYLAMRGILSEDEKQLQSDLTTIFANSDKLSEEQITELSKKTLGSYINKSSLSMHNSGVTAANHNSASADYDTNYRSGKGSIGDHNLSVAHKNKAVAAQTKALKRYDGIKKATAKLTKEDIDQFTPEDIIDLLMSEEYMQLDELSKKTLGSYIKGAGQHRINLAKKEKDLDNERNNIDRAKHYSDDKETRDNLDKASSGLKKQSDKVNDKSYKRYVGISRAVSKLTKEQQEFVLGLVGEISKESE